jgi:hypothetical protein
MTPYPARIPDEDDWTGHERDLESNYAYRHMFGKSIDDVMYDFRWCAIERGIELRSMPRTTFRSYVFAFAKLLNSPGEGVAQSDCASVFLNVLREREKSHPGSVAEIYPALRATIEHVAANQAFFDADVGIYGGFRDCAAEIEALCEAPHARR